MQYNTIQLNVSNIVLYCTVDRQWRIQKGERGKEQPPPWPGPSPIDRMHLKTRENFAPKCIFCIKLSLEHPSPDPTPTLPPLFLISGSATVDRMRRSVGLMKVQKLLFVTSDGSSLELGVFASPDFGG